jgi:predicted glutamine amidotransferase
VQPVNRMCEILAVASPSPVAFPDVFGWAKAMEDYGMAGFGWGVAWMGSGKVESYLDLTRIRGERRLDDQLERVESTRYLIHLRRPSRLSTISLADTQPFVAPGGALAFCHNGTFVKESDLRADYASRLRGSADSELGFVLMQEALDSGFAPEESLNLVQERLAGTNNVACLSSAGDVAVGGWHPANAVWEFRYGTMRIAATGLHSADNSLFDLVFPDATDRRIVEGTRRIT